MSTTVVVGVRITKEVGLSFFGVDEVNAALKAGRRVIALEPSSALVQQIADGEESVRHAFSGFTLKVVIED
jgi:hypothetical protein